MQNFTLSNSEKPLEGGKQKDQIKLAKIKISGQTENVEIATSCVHERCEDEVYNPFDVIQTRFENVTFQEYLLFKHNFENRSFEMDHKNDCLIISGKRKELKYAADQIEKLLAEVKNYFSCPVSVQGCDRFSVEQEIELFNQQKSNAFCIYERFKDIVYIYAHEAKTLKRLREKLQQKLSSAVQKPGTAISQESLKMHSEVSTSGKKTQDKKESKLQSKEPSLSTDGRRDNGNITSHRKAPERQFSWTQDTKNCQVYKVDRLLVKVYEGDILRAPVDCIVNPANRNLHHDGGLAYTIAAAAGNTVNIESEKIVKHKGINFICYEILRI